MAFSNEAHPGAASATIFVQRYSRMCWALWLCSARTYSSWAITVCQHPESTCSVHNPITVILPRTNRKLRCRHSSFRSAASQYGSTQEPSFLNRFFSFLLPQAHEATSLIQHQESKPKLVFSSICSSAFSGPAERDFVSMPSMTSSERIFVCDCNLHPNVIVILLVVFLGKGR